MIEIVVILTIFNTKIEMEDNIKQRLMQLIKHLGMTTKSFEIRCGMSNGYIRSMRRGLGVEKLDKVLSEFPELNRDWLLFGDGEMFVSPDTTEPKQPKVIQHPKTLFLILFSSLLPLFFFLSFSLLPLIFLSFS